MPHSGFKITCIQRMACWSAPDEELPSIESAPYREVLIRPKGKGKGKGAPPPPTAACKGKGRAKISNAQSRTLSVPGKVPGRARGGRGEFSLEDHGEAPAQLKARRVVNWNPIRQEQLLEGSVWTKINHSIGERGHDLLPKEVLSKAFTHPAAKAKSKPLPKPKARKSSVIKVESRVLSAREAFLADLLYRQLDKLGADHQQIFSIVGMPEAFDKSAERESASPSQPGVETLCMSGCDGKDKFAVYLENAPSDDMGLNRSNSEAVFNDKPVLNQSKSEPSFKKPIPSSSFSSNSSSGSSGSRSTKSEGSDSEASDIEKSTDEPDSDSDSDSESESDSGSETESDEDGIKAVSVDSFEVLMNLLRLAEKVQEGLKKDTKGPLAAPELLLQQLLTKVGPPEVLRSRVQASCCIRKLSNEADELARKMCLSIKAANIILKSSAIPSLLEGVLVLGNYVNSASRQLGEACGITIDSIAKLAHTRTIKSSSSNGENDNALCMVVHSVQQNEKDPLWFFNLHSELENCREACGLDTNTVKPSLKNLAHKVSTTRECLQHVPCLQARLKRFLGEAYPRLAMLQSLEDELHSKTVAMRSYFAEPGSSSLSDMLCSLSAILDFLPKPDVFLKAKEIDLADTKSDVPAYVDEPDPESTPVTPRKARASIFVTPDKEAPPASQNS